MRLNILAFVLGVGWLQYRTVLPEVECLWLLFSMAVAVGLFGFLRAATHIVISRILFVIFFLVFGFCWAAILAHWRLSDSLPRVWERKAIQIVGVIANVPQENNRSVRFQLDVEHVNTEGAIVPKRIALSWYKVRQSGANQAALPTVSAGERWQLTVHLKRPHGSQNPHSYDFERWALERNIRATGYVGVSPENQRLQLMVQRPAYWIAHIREGIQHRFAASLANQNYVGILQTLATGDQNAIPRDQWQVFARTGTNHLMAISGVHITMISSVVFAMVYWLWRCSAYLALRVPARRAAVMAGLIVAFSYAVLSGFAIPAQRAFYMLAVVAIVLWMGRQIPATTVLAWALFGVILIDPWAILAPGFWLSFGAVAVIMLLTVGRIGKIHWLSGWLRIQWAEVASQIRTVR